MSRFEERARRHLLSGSRPARPSDLLVLLALIDAAGGGRRAHISVNRIAERSRLSPATVKRALRRLRNEGVLRKVADGGGRGRPCVHELADD